MWKSLIRTIARRPRDGDCTKLKLDANDECVTMNNTVEISRSNIGSAVHSQVSTPIAIVGKRRNYKGVDQMVEAIQMASECKFNSAPTIKWRGESDYKWKMSSPNHPEIIECEKDLKRELKELKQKFAKEYDRNRVCSPRVFFLL